MTDMDIDSHTSADMETNNSSSKRVLPTRKTAAAPAATTTTTTATTSATSSNKKADHFNTILKEALPAGTVVTDDVLDRLSKALGGIISEVAKEAATVASKANRGRGVVQAPAPRKSSAARSVNSVSKPKARPVKKEFEVESIANHRVVNNRLEFHIKWKGYPAGQNTWETKAALDNCKELLTTYAKKHKLAI